MSRKERLLIAVWEAWRDGHPASVRLLARRAGYLSPSSIGWGKLEEDGWIKRATHRWHYAITPGPRFGGIYQGKAMRIIRDDDEAKARRRKTKWERHGVLFEARR